MAGLRRRKKKSEEYQDVELNIMPFIDVFSVLTTFLLISTAFASFGVLKVQVPFFTNKEAEDSKPKRTLSVNVEVERQTITLVTKYSMPPINEEKQTFQFDDNGLASLHDRLVQLRLANLETDLVTCFTEDDVLYEQLIKVVDAVKLRKDKDPVIPNSEVGEEPELITRSYLFPKVVLGSVIL